LRGPADRLLRAITSPCRVARAWRPDSGSSPPERHLYTALWDTGATDSCISGSIVEECRLPQYGERYSQGIFAGEIVGIYLVDLWLTDSIVLRGLRCLGVDIPGADVLIGMDVISQGDFAVTNYQSRTQFSFRSPSQGHIDFTAEHRRTAD